MKRSPVQSSNVAAIGYDPYLETLEVEFRPGRDGFGAVWQYAPVPRGLFAELFGEGKSAGAAVATLRVNSDIRAVHVGDACHLELDAPEMQADNEPYEPADPGADEDEAFVRSYDEEDA